MIIEEHSSVARRQGASRSLPHRGVLAGSCGTCLVHAKGGPHNQCSASNDVH